MFIATRAGVLVPKVFDGDPYYSNVSLLLHGDGANGSTTIIDSSPTPKTATVFGSAQISTAQSKWGGSSLYFDGSGSYLRYPSHSGFEFGSGDFTVERFVRRGVVNSEQVLITYGPQDQSTAYAPLLLIRFNGNNSIQAYCNTSETASAVFGNCASSASFSSTSTWYHVAYVRSGSNFYLFVDGVLVASATSSNTQGSGAGSYLFLGRDCRSVPYYYTGYQEEVRITKGVARYTAAFTPPTAPFPGG
ncbi:LamG domain-containing protein [Acidovorax sp. BL-A-41-H1]|uniref:LamG domain-containing protein n=1 Tax=Acidovorax sp. BL-A-41-H1 TaxID=3421102 RepID=UPI003F7A8EA8